MNERLERIDNRLITNLGTNSSREFSKGQLQEATQLPHAPARLTSPPHTTKVSKLSGKQRNRLVKSVCSITDRPMRLPSTVALCRQLVHCQQNSSISVFVSFGSKQSNKGWTQSRKYLFRIQTAHLASFCKWGISPTPMFIVFSWYTISVLARATSSLCLEPRRVD